MRENGTSHTDRDRGASGRCQATGSRRTSPYLPIKCSHAQLRQWSMPARTERPGVVGRASPERPLTFRIPVIPVARQPCQPGVECAECRDLVAQPSGVVCCYACREPEFGSPTRHHIETSWMRFPQVSSSTAVVTGPMTVGGCVNVTPASMSRSYSAGTSSTAKEASGTPSAVTDSR